MHSRQASEHALHAGSLPACFSHSAKHLRLASAHLLMIAGVHVPDSHWRAHVTHSRLQATQARKHANRDGSLAMATAQASIHSRHASAHVQHALSECFSPLTPGVCARLTAAIANNPNTLSKTFRRIIDQFLQNKLKFPRLSNQFTVPAKLRSKGRASTALSWQLARPNTKIQNLVARTC